MAGKRAPRALGAAKLAAGAALALGALAVLASWPGTGAGESTGTGTENAARGPDRPSAELVQPALYAAAPLASAGRTELEPPPAPTAEGATGASAASQRAPGVVRGLVHDPHGNPVAGALARVGQREMATAGADGRFSFEIASANPVVLHAIAPGFGPSPAREVSATSGEELEVELVLRAEAVLAGIVLDAEGRPDVEVEVGLGPLRADPAVGATAQTGSDGRFEFRGLGPGAYIAVAHDPDEELAGSARPLRMRQVTLDAGASAEVVLGGPRAVELPLAIHVTLAGAAFDRGGVFLLPEGPDLLDRAQSAPLDQDGRAHFRASAGRYAVSVSREDGAPQVTRTVEIGPGAPEVVEIALPSGRVTGSVLGPDGPLEGCPVWIEREDHWNPFALGIGPEVKSGRDGSFAFEGLEAGSYTLRARGSRPIFDLELSHGGAAAGLVLRVEETGGLGGRVLDPAGAPRSGAALHLRGPEGRWLAHWADATTAVETGGFELRNLPPGKYTLFARHGELASPESEPVVVEAGKMGDLELHLAPGALLRLSLVENDGAPAASADFQIFDARGRSCGEPRTVHDLELLLAEGLAPNGRAIGPLAPGNYLVEARGPAGRQANALRELVPGWNELVLRLP